AAGLERFVESRDLLIQELSSLGDEHFDGLISAFASLSTVPHLMPFARDAARLVRPGGRLLLHMLNRFSLWECVGYAAQGDWVAAEHVGRERRRNFAIGGQSVQHFMHFADDVYRRYFMAAFRLRERYGLGAIRPPHTLHRLPVPLVARLE